MRTLPFLFGLVLAAAPALADFTDTDAATMAAASPAVVKSMQTIDAAITALPADLKEPTRDALLAPDGCIAYRRGETDQTRTGVVNDLIAQGFATDAAALTRSLYGYPVRTDKTCVHPAAPLLATPGSEENSHHAWPGGLADHIAFNLHAADDTLARYREVMQDPAALDGAALDAAVLWHDWAKRLVLHWSDAGIVSYESPIGGTSSHHVIGLAEAMARGLPAREIVIQVCAHQAPANERDAKVVGWLRAAAIIAHVDPVKTGYLKTTADGYALIVTPECRIHTMSDANYVYGVPALRHAQAVIARLAPQIGINPDDRRFVLSALSYYGAERFDAADQAESLKLLQDLKQKLADWKKTGRIGPNDD